jgi:Na+/proline symporter
MVEFTVAMIGAILLAGVALYKVGGPTGLREKLDALALGGAHENLATGGAVLDFLPSMASETFSALTVGVYLGVMWWSSPYVDGSGQRAQRFLSCKNEGHALIAGIWNMAVQWIIRSWPWYVVALVSIVMYPTLKDGETAYPRMVVDLLPSVPRAIMVASFFAAFMSTFTGLLNLCASYLSNDVYRRFLVKQGTERHYLAASRGFTLGVAAIAGTLALLLPSVLGAFRFKMELMAGMGLVAVLRWFWWRVNATTELVALVTSVATALTVRFVPGLEADTADASALRLLMVVTATAAVTIVTALVTRPDPREKLVAFFERVRPPKALWGPIAAMARPGDRSTITLGTFGQFGLAVVFVFSAMFGLGKVILGEPALGLGLLAVSAACFYVLWRWVIQGALGEGGANPPRQDGAGGEGSSTSTST